MALTWQNMNPKAKRWAVIAGTMAGISAVVMMIPDGKTQHKGAGNQDVIRHVLTDRDTRTVGMDSLAAEIKSLSSKTVEQGRKMEKLARDLEQTKRQQTSVPPVVNSQIEKLTTELGHLKDNLREMEQRQKEAEGKGKGHVKGDAEGNGDSSADQPASAAGYGKPFTPSSTAGLSDLTLKNPVDIFQGARLPTATAANGPKSQGKSGGGAPTIQVFKEASAKDTKDTPKEPEDVFYMPAGSIITGVLLNGMDAPTGQGARNQPFPSTMRIQKEAILPNRFRADVRECFVVIAGYGDLSSERAYLRGETISCVRQDGAVIEAPLDSYAVGEDGKAGVRGRLVSKQGQVIARSLMAGFMSGLSQAFDVKPVAVLDTSNSGGGSTQFQRNEPNNDWLRSAAASGASSALERVADFYLKMAEGIFPVIEVDAGRQVDLIVNKGAKLQFRSVGIKP